MADGHHLETVKSQYLSNSWLLAGKYGMIRHWPNELYCATPYIKLVILRNKSQKVYKQKLPSISLLCKSRRFKTANIKILSAD